MERKENFSEYCHDYLCQQLDAYEGCDCYACDLAYKITEGCNIDGTLTYSTFTAKCYLQAWWDDCSDFSDFEKWNFGERTNPFENPEAYMVRMVIEGIYQLLASCECLEEVWDEEIELTPELIRQIKEETPETISFA